ncbi:DoxX family membrane protein [Flavobacterium sp.]|uniref:DoxX family membrane protein n=1 Tax=Flavobacterium sp. TaxID=239 RepID=UPI0037521933
MRIATIIVRLLLGALLLFASISYFFHLMPEPAFTGNMKTFNEGIAASGYLMPLAKVVELIAGLTFVTGKFMKIGAIIAVPVTLNILLINAFMMPEGTPIAAALFVGNLFLIYTNWNSYKHLFTA